jgi:hypothetical protein
MQAQDLTDRTEDPVDDPPAPEAPRSSNRRGFSLRGFTSLLLTIAFVAMCFSGVMLFLTPRGRVANWTDWSLLGLGKHEWGAVHINNSVLFVVIAATHLVLNWSIFVRYLKNKAVAGLNMKKELALASLVAAAFLAGPIYSVPPFSSLMALNEDIKNYWEQHAEQPPVPHAEEMTLTELAGHVHLTVEQVSSALADKGFQVTQANLTVGEVGQQKGVAPSVVFAAIQEQYPESRGWGRVRGTDGRGGGCDESESGQCSDQKANACSDGDGEAHQGPGQGRGGGWGQGRGMGMGRGMGRGMGMGGGTGMGRGMGGGMGPGRAEGGRHIEAGAIGREGSQPDKVSNGDL